MRVSPKKRNGNRPAKALTSSETESKLQRKWKRVDKAPFVSPRTSRGPSALASRPCARAQQRAQKHLRPHPHNHQRQQHLKKKTFDRGAYAAFEEAKETKSFGHGGPQQTHKRAVLQRARKRQTALACQDATLQRAAKGNTCVVGGSSCECSDVNKMNAGWEMSVAPPNKTVCKGAKEGDVPRFVDPLQEESPVIVKVASPPMILPEEIHADVPSAKYGLGHTEVIGEDAVRKYATTIIMPPPKELGDANVDLFEVAEKLRIVERNRTMSANWFSSTAVNRTSMSTDDQTVPNDSQAGENEAIAVVSQKAKKPLMRLPIAAAAASISSELSSLLETYLAADDHTLRVLSEMGICTAEDLQFVDEEDLVAAGCRRVLSRKLTQIASMIGASSVHAPASHHKNGRMGEESNDHRDDNADADADDVDNDDDDDDNDRERDFSMLLDDDECSEAIADEGSDNEQIAVADVRLNLGESLPTMVDARRLVTAANQLAGGRYYEEALQHYYQAIGIYDHLKVEVEGEHHLRQSEDTKNEQRLSILKDIAKTLNNLAAVLHQLKRFDEAMVAYSRALETKKTSLGEGHFSVGKNRCFVDIGCLVLCAKDLTTCSNVCSVFFQDTLFITW